MAAEIDNKKRWACPSDRELTLRAKLNAGWSVHSQDYFHKPEPILEVELRYIENVMERAKEVEEIERERIRKMMCKLENMRRASIGDGKSTCSMCGDSFGFLRSSFIQCCDCSMAVCEKCSIDIHNGFEDCVLCKICSEHREVWKKSGGWFYGALPQVEKLNCDELKCYQTSASDTWAHRARDIVRLESFEAPEKTRSNKTFYKTWAINSSPDLNLIEDALILKKFKKNKFRKSSEGGVHLDKHRLSVPTLHNSKISASCPTLQGLPEDSSNPMKKTKKKFSKKMFLKPARKLVEKITKHHKMFY